RVRIASHLYAATCSESQVSLFLKTLLLGQPFAPCDWVRGCPQLMQPRSISLDIPAAFLAVELVGRRPEPYVWPTLPVREVVPAVPTRKAIVRHLVVFESCRGQCTMRFEELPFEVFFGCLIHVAARDPASERRMWFNCKSVRRNMLNIQT